MPPEVNVTTDPLVVYGMVALFGAAVVLALVFARPRRGLGAVKRSEVPDQTAGGQPWMPGGDIFGHDPQPGPESPAGVDPSRAAPPAGPPVAPPVNDPWSTGATGEAEPQPRWDKR